MKKDDEKTVDRVVGSDEEDKVVEASCGNVFADLGLPDADRLFAEAQAKIDKELRISPVPRSG